MEDALFSSVTKNMKPLMFMVETQVEGEEKTLLTFLRQRLDADSLGDVALYHSEFRLGRLSSSSVQVDLLPIAELSDDGRSVVSENGRTPPIKIVSRDQDEETHWAGVYKAASIIYGHKRGRPLCTNSMLRDLSDEIQKLF
jgi:hypothetical protein